MDYLNIWLYTCATLVTLAATWKTIRFLGWKKKLMFYTVREMAKGKGAIQGTLMWPALIVDTVLMPVYAFAALLQGTIDKQLELVDLKAIETGKAYWNDKAFTWLQEDFNKTKNDLRDLIDVWVSDESVIELEAKVKELEMEITRVEKLLKEQAASKKELYQVGIGPDMDRRPKSRQMNLPFVY